MKIVEYPEELDPQSKGIWQKFCERNYLKYGKFLSQFERICARLVEDDSLFEYYAKSGHIKNLGDELWEFRIPPTGRGGVLRVYFCFAKSSQKKIVILDAEVKKKSKGSLEKAKKRLKIYREWERGEKGG